MEKPTSCMSLSNKTEGMGGDNHSIKNNIAENLEVGLMANKFYVYWNQNHIIKFFKH